MFKEETLMETEQRQYEEPDGEFLEVIERGSNSITVLTKLDSEKAGVGVEPLLHPPDFSVSELKEELRGLNPSEEQREKLLEAERDGKDRKTAKAAIKDL